MKDDRQLIDLVAVDACHHIAYFGGAAYSVVVGVAAGHQDQQGRQREKCLFHVECPL